DDPQAARAFDNVEGFERFSQFFLVISIFVVVIGCGTLAAGVVGVSNIMMIAVKERTKEIGVRKVLGASLFHVWRMLSKDFVLLVVISCAIAVPIAYYFLYRWLQSYEYRTPLSWWVFVAASVGALVITLLTVSWQAIRAGMLNPVKSLRTE
ncbi:MAG TPA: FtsX-like permease family protein, partial [Puia sp.]|nr:FtsX-like permease family protein [Puia sp.]